MSVGDDLLAHTRKVLREPQVRLEVSFAFTTAGVTPCVVIYVKSPKERWIRADIPLIMPPDGGSRGDLLRLLAGLCDPA